MGILISKQAKFIGMIDNIQTMPVLNFIIVFAQFSLVFVGAVWVFAFAQSLYLDWRDSVEIDAKKLDRKPR